jgi:hypothetical protein
MSKGKNLVIFEEENYPLLAQNPNEIVESFVENYEGEEVTKNDIFVKISTPKGDDAAWTVETENGKEVLDELTGVILYIGNERAYFEGDYDDPDASHIPLCTSEDGKTGYPTRDSDFPGGDCTTCAKKDFGPNGELPECSNRKPIYAYIPEVNEGLPCRIDVTPTSFKQLADFRRKTSQFNLKFWDCETRFSMTKGKSKNGRPASIMGFERICNIKKTKPEAYAAVLKLRQAFLPYMAPVSAMPPGEEKAA